MKRIILLLLLSQNIFAFEGIEIGNEQYGDFPSDTYIVTNDIVVDSGKTLSFEAGTVLKFDEFTGMHVHGKLRILPEDDSSVVFTSLTEGLWNGITVYEHGSLEMANARIENSLNGISLSDSLNIDIFENIVYNNVFEPFVSIGEEKILMENETPFSIVIKREEKPIEKKEKKRSPTLLITRAVTAVTMAVGVGVWMYYRESTEHYLTKYELSSSNLDSYKREAERRQKRSYLGAAAAFGSLPLFAISISLDDKMFRRTK